MKRKGRIKIERTEQWEYTATLGKVPATGASSMTAELHLLRKIVFGKDTKQPRISE